MATDLEDHNQGQEDGAKATFLDELAVNWNPLLSSAYRAGFRHGIQNKSTAEAPKENQRDESEASKRSTSSTGDDDTPWFISLFLVLFMFAISALFVVVRWTISRPWRVALVLILVAVVAISNRQPSGPQSSSQPSVTPVPVQEATVEAPPALAAPEPQPTMAESAPTNPTFVPLGHFSDGTYYLELYRDDRSGGQVVGLITAFPQDVSKKPSVGELLDVVGTGSDGPLSFRTTWADYMPHFQGSVKGDEIEGDYDTTFETEPRHIVFQRYADEDATTYSNREEWSKHVAEQRACCGPGTSSDETTDH